MDEITQLSIFHECQRLTTLYCHYVDHGEASRIADLFSVDGICKVGGEHRGRDQIRKAFRVREENKGRISRHVCNNFVLNSASDTEASGTVYLTLYRSDGPEDRKIAELEGPVVVGEYRDKYVKTSEGWRFSYREVEASFVKS